jgi:hypothetical protein
MALEAPWLKQAAWLVVGRIPGGKEPHHSRFAALPRQKQPLLCRHHAQVAIGRFLRPFPSKSASLAPVNPFPAFARCSTPRRTAEEIMCAGTRDHFDVIKRVSHRDGSSTSRLRAGAGLQPLDEAIPQYNR